MHDSGNIPLDDKSEGMRENLQNASKEEQIEEMRDWFLENYEDPAERTPYESREGGYIWIWGGPYDAQEEIGDEFGGIVPDDVIEELSSELNEICWQWAPTANPSDYDEYLVNDIAKITKYYHNYMGSILDIKKLLETDIDGSVKHCFYRLLHVNVITAMETYLSDAFINLVVSDAKLMRTFIESTPEYKAEKIPLADVYKAAEGIEQRAKKYLADAVWHNLSRVKQMYKSVLGIEFVISGQITKKILKRHDIVHRNGKTKDGKEILIKKEDVKDLISMVEVFIKEVDKKLSEMKSNTRFHRDCF